MTAAKTVCGNIDWNSIHYRILEKYLEGLNPEQLAAVTYLDGPELVIAGAGSGKTRVLTHKVMHLLAKGYEPWRILALTFTNKASREMRERIRSLVGDAPASKIWMGTFHSIFSRLLRQHADRIGYRSSFTIYDTNDSRSLIKIIVKDMGLDEKVYKPAIIQSEISRAKNMLVSPEAYALSPDIMEADRRARRGRTAEIYRAYRDRCIVSSAMDFDDLLYYTERLLRENQDILHHYQEYFRYVLVDEYQDTNFAQHQIIQLLTRENNALCVVGDDAQSIYSFRGANIRNILDLKQHYPDLATFKLERNYRSTQNITEAANRLIAANRYQIPKKVFSENEPGTPVEVMPSYSDYEESFLIANRIQQLKMRTSDSYENTAVLYRTNAQSRILEESLRKRNIPYRIYGGLSFYQRKEVKDAISYFRLSVNPNDDEALRRIINTPARGIGDTTLAKVTRAAMDSKASLWDVISDPDRFSLPVNSATLRKLSAFADLMTSFHSKAADESIPADEIARDIIGRTGLISSLIHENTPESVSRRENLIEVLNGVSEFVASKMEEGDSTHIHLTDFLAEISLATDQDSIDDPDTEKITLMTAHAAKGLEFNNVFVVGVEEDLFPSALSQDSPQQIEEERRLLYVAITRARKFCMLSYAKSRFRNGQTCACRPSRFLADMGLTPNSKAIHDATGQFHPQPLPDRRTPVRPETPRSITPKIYSTHSASSLTPGMHIRHERFGEGRIESVDPDNTSGARIVVNFDNSPQKTLLLAYAKFEIIE